MESENEKSYYFSKCWKCRQFAERQSILYIIQLIWINFKNHYCNSVIGSYWNSKSNHENFYSIHHLNCLLSSKYIEWVLHRFSHHICSKFVKPKSIFVSRIINHSFNSYSIWNKAQIIQKYDINPIIMENLSTYLMHENWCKCHLYVIN